MISIFLFLMAIVLLYGAGRLVYKNRRQHATFVKVFVHFTAMLLSSLITISIILITASLLLVFVSETVPHLKDLPNDTNKIASVRLLSSLLILVLLTAISQFWIRRKLFKKIPKIRLSLKEYEIIEYFIQWTTIFVIVYQFAFDGFVNISKILPELGASAETFSVILSPNNINLILQPLLISTWVLIAMEKISMANEKSARVKSDEN